nr:hypothetical protein [Longibaculum muris]
MDFFETSIKASKARILGDFLLQEAMKSNKQLSFPSFDRMFPSQDYHSGKSFGNCIALPLQFEAIQQGHSLFINEFQEPIHKPFHYLRTTAKVKEEHINQIIQNHTTHFKDYFEIQDSLLKKEQIQQSITIHENSMLCINKKGLNANTLLTLRKISTIYNPEFYKNINLHLSVFGIPRTLCENIENDKEILIPRDLKNTLFKCINIEFLNYVDKTFEGQNIDISFKGALKPNQQIAADTLLQHEIAMIEAIPGFG